MTSEDTLKRLQAFLERNGLNPQPPKPSAKELERREMIQMRMAALLRALRS